MMDANRRVATTLAALLLLLSAACDRGDRAAAGDAQWPDDSAPAAEGPQAEFLASLQQLCGNAYEGRVIESSPGDTVFAGRHLVMHVRECSPDEVRIPFHVGENRSRTWILTRLDDGIRLKHDHRHEDGTDDEITMYGGDTADAGTATVQQFPADDYTAQLVPAARTNVWTVEVVPGQHFAYALRREGTDRRLRVEFDLTRAVEAPPAPWGAQD
jgi:hypothetical protein